MEKLVGVGASPGIAIGVAHVLASRVEIHERRIAGDQVATELRRFETALGVGPRDAWMIGDNLEWEVVTPQRLGIYAIWIDVHGDGLPEGSTVRPDRIIRSLTELVPRPG